MLVPMLLAFAAQGGAASCGRSDAHSERAVLSAEDRWVKSLERRDAAGLACLLAEEFTDTNWAGEIVPRDRILAALATRPPARLALSEVTVALHGGMAVVHGLNRQSDGAGKIVGTVRFTDVFLYRDGRWQAISAQETPTADN